MKAILQPFSEATLGDVLRSALGGEMGEYNRLDAAVAFVKLSGVTEIQEPLEGFVSRGNQIRMIVGVDFWGSSYEALSALLSASGASGRIFVNHNEGSYTFHPKLYLFEGDTDALLIVGSGNLTQGRLETNDEASLVCTLDLNDDADRAILEQVKQGLDNWCDEARPTVKKLDEAFLEKLAAEDYVRRETRTEPEGISEAKAADIGAPQPRPPLREGRNVLFGREHRRRRPRRRKPRAARPRRRPGVPTADLSTPSDEPRGFVMTLQQTDVGFGQMTPGASRRSPEIFVPLTARNQHPEFWGWEEAFTEDPSRKGKFDRQDVRMRIGGRVVSVNMMTWPVKHDFRLRSEALRSAGDVGDLLVIEKTEEGSGLDYDVQVIQQGTREYDIYSAICVNKTPNSPRLWGYYD